MSWKKNAQWDKFCIAFYGETNAGKSTIIESLRLAFKEETKLKAQQKFKELYANMQERFPHFEQTLKEYENTNKNFNDKIKELKDKKESIFSIFQEKEKTHQANKSASFIYRIKSFFNLTQLSKEIKAHAQEIKNLENEIKTNQEEQEALEKQVREIEKEKEALKTYADGAIICGAVDFTKKVQSYNFEYEGQKISLLDVPGIEGDEEKVKDEIKKALQMAHCVFYVTIENTPPQKGDEEKQRKGTLEKIKEQLNAQAEIWTLYNKSAPNVKNLEGEFSSLKDENSINEKMKEILQDHYKGTLCVSAYIAFCVLAECLIDKNKKSREKFLSQKSKEDLLELTKFNDF